MVTWILSPMSSTSMYKVVLSGLQCVVFEVLQPGGVLQVPFI